MTLSRITGKAAGIIFLLAGASLVSAQNFEALKVPSPLGEMVRDLDANERGPDGSTPLQWAVYDQDVDRVRALIRAGADVNAENNFGANAMQLAAEAGHDQLIELLLDAGADPDSANSEGQTALMLVARAGDVEAAKLLIKSGATIDARESWGMQTALMWAASQGHGDVVEVLLEYGADYDARTLQRTQYIKTEKPQDSPADYKEWIEHHREFQTRGKKTCVAHGALGFQAFW